MLKNSVLKNIAFLGIVFFMPFFLQHCGQRGTPTGGPTDVEPPKINSSSPENFSTNFKGQKITLKFDEYVQVKSFQTEFIISPPVKSPPSYKLVGKKLVLSFDSAFVENTTYTLYFGKAIVDLNESNPLDSNLFVFSTGAVLDSLELSGEITDAYTGEAEDEILVHLYKNLSDSAPKTTLPSYFAVAKNGRFTFKNLAAGNYKVFALQDGNNNYLYDLPNEKIAFSSEIIIVPSDSIDIVLHSFLTEQTEQKILKGFSPENNLVVIPFSLPAVNHSINYFNDTLNTDSIFEFWNEAHDSLYLYSKQFEADQAYYLQVKTDTLVSDTFRIKIKKKENKFYTAFSYKEVGNNNFNEALSFSFNKPLQGYCDSCILLYTEKDTMYLNGNSLNDNKNKLTVNHRFLPENEYSLVVLPNAFTSILNEENDSLKYSFKMAKEGVYGNLILKYDFKINGNYIFIFSKAAVQIEERKSVFFKGELNFKGLSAGDYQLKVIVDEDGNGKWTPGNYDLKKPSEKVIIYKNAITIRENWDLDLEWNLE